MVRVVVNRAVPTESDDLAIRTHGQNTNFKINLEGYARKLTAMVDDLSLDLLEIAAAIFAFDGLERRGGPVRTMFAASWHRDFHFIIPVRKPEFWSKEAVNNALVAAVSFLADDAYAFTFTTAVAPALRQDFFRFGADVDGAFQADDVILFSAIIYLTKLLTESGKSRTLSYAYPRRDPGGKDRNLDFRMGSRKDSPKEVPLVEGRASRFLIRASVGVAVC